MDAKESVVKISAEAMQRGVSAVREEAGKQLPEGARISRIVRSQTDQATGDMRMTIQYTLPPPEPAFADFDAYQEWARTMVVNPAKQDLYYYALEACDEAGEVAGKVKKLIRDENGVLTPEYAEEIAKEVGDALFPLAMLADKLNMKFSDIAKGNYRKLNSRKARGVLGGSGDNR